MTHIIDDIYLDSELESEIEGPAKEYAKARGWFTCKLMKCDINGMPDDLFIRTGQVIFIEFKAPGEPPSEQQKKRHRQIRKHGIPVHVVDDLGQAKTILR